MNYQEAFGTNEYGISGPILQSNSENQVFAYISSRLLNTQQFENVENRLVSSVDNTNRNFLQLYSLMRDELYNENEVVAKEADSADSADNIDYTNLTTEEIEKCHNIVLTYKNIKAEYDKANEKYNTYCQDISKNQVLRNEIHKASTLFLNALNDTFYKEVLGDTKEFQNTILELDIQKINLLDTYDKKIVFEKEVLKEKLDKFTSQLTYMRSFFSELLQGVIKEENQNNHTCNICFERKIQSVLVPCGHTFCEQCIKTSERTQTSNSQKKCGICRSGYSQAIKIYL